MVKVTSSINTRDPNQHRASPKGFIGLLVFFTLWCFTPFIIPTAIFFSYSHSNHSLSLAILLYYSFRYIIPATKWPTVYQGMVDCFKCHSYFKRQGVVLIGPPIAPDSKTMLCFHPHGALCVGWTFAIGNELLCGVKTKITWLVAPLLFRIPLISDYLRWMQVGPIGPAQMKKLMREGKNVALLPGGFNCENQPIATAASLRIELVSSNIACSLGEMITVVGDAIQLPKIEDPTREDVAKYHAIYMKSLVALFNDNKKEYCADPNAEIELE
ncbi:hypothetical protein ScalyP_jg755 [Parmales sp. scaly parma]|nr:hypothetical protein ScalyP_jg755 [Parmales sp. scaly parma]